MNMFLLSTSQNERNQEFLIPLFQLPHWKFTGFFAGHKVEAEESGIPHSSHFTVCSTTDLRLSSYFASPPSQMSRASGLKGAAAKPKAPAKSKTKTPKEGDVLGSALSSVALMSDLQITAGAQPTSLSQTPMDEQMRAIFSSRLFCDLFPHLPSVLSNF